MNKLFGINVKCFGSDLRPDEQYAFLRVSVLLLDTGAAAVKQAEPRSAVPISHAADFDSGLLEHLVQRGLLNGCWGDALLVCQILQLPERGKGSPQMRFGTNVGMCAFVFPSSVNNYKV